VEVKRVSHQGDVILYIECPVCENRVSVVDGYPVSGAEAEKELRSGFEVHVKNHQAAETRAARARHR
jgi:hypothetical protein